MDNNITVSYGIAYKEKEFGCIVEQDCYDNYDYAKEMYDRFMSENNPYVEIIKHTEETLLKHNSPCVHNYIDSGVKEEGNILYRYYECEYCGERKEPDIYTLKENN